MTYPARRPYGENGYSRNSHPRSDSRDRPWYRDEAPVHEPAPAPFYPKGKKLMILKDRYHDYAAIVRLGKAGPHVALDMTNIHECWESFAKLNFVATEQDHKGAIIVALFEGKFVVLIGHEQVREAVATGNPYIFSATLLSNPGIKKAYLADVNPS